MNSMAQIPVFPDIFKCPVKTPYTDDAIWFIKFMHERLGFTSTIRNLIKQLEVLTGKVTTPKNLYVAKISLEEERRIGPITKIIREKITESVLRKKGRLKDIHVPLLMESAILDLKELLSTNNKKDEYFMIPYLYFVNFKLKYPEKYYSGIKKLLPRILGAISESSIRDNRLNRTYNSMHYYEEKPTEFMYFDKDKIIQRINALSL